MKLPKISLVVALLCFSAVVYSQTDSAELKIFEQVEVEASYPGGETAWRLYLEKNLDASVPIKNSAPSGRYTVWIQFIVNREGGLSELKALTRMGYGMEAEVIRIISKSGKWEPAWQNGKYVKAYRKQPVTFMVEDENFSIKAETPYTLFTGTDNTVTIDVPKFKPEELQVNILPGRILRGPGNTYTVRVNKPGRTVIEIYSLKKGKRIGAASFEVLAPEEAASEKPKSTN